MTKETKNTVAAETIVENLKEFAVELNKAAKAGEIASLIEGDKDSFLLAKISHDISNGLAYILQGKSADVALEQIFGDDEDEEDGTTLGSIAVNIKTGDAKGIENIKDPKIRKQLAEAVQKLADKLGGK